MCLQGRGGRNGSMTQWLNSSLEKQDFIQDNADTNDNDHRQRAVSVMITSMRVHWRKQFKEAIVIGEKSEKDPFDGLENDFDKNEWTW